MFDKKLLATLRLHSAPVTCIEPFYLPSTSTFTVGGNENKVYPIFNPSLLTADESGLVIWWNISTRRPLGMWKAHTDTILSVKQLGLAWKKEGEDLNVNTASLDELYGTVLTQSKDGSIKIWRLIELLSGLTGDFVYTAILKKKLVSMEELVQAAPPVLFEMPVNPLNFANVDINQSGYLITPATTDSEGFDIYKIDVGASKEHQKLKRLVQNQKFQLESSKEDDIVDEVEEPDLTKRGGSGVVMKVVWIDNEKFFVGYESGIIVGYQITLESSEKARITTFISDDSLLGNPITSICFDKDNQRLLWASTGSKLCILTLDKLDEPCRVYDTKRKGINHIDVDFSTNAVGIITWDGYTRIYEYDQEDVLKFILKMRRQIPTILSSKESTDNGNDEITQINNLQMQRANTLKFTEKQVDPKIQKNITVGYTNGRCKNVVKRNREEIFGERWMFVGYQDGKIAIYLIT